MMKLIFTSNILLFERIYSLTLQLCFDDTYTFKVFKEHILSTILQRHTHNSFKNI